MIDITAGRKFGASLRDYGAGRKRKGAAFVTAMFNPMFPPVIAARNRTLSFTAGSGIVPTVLVHFGLHLASASQSVALDTPII